MRNTKKVQKKNLKIEIRAKIITNFVKAPKSLDICRKENKDLTTCFKFFL